jgi:hypothetical protein
MANWLDIDAQDLLERDAFARVDDGERGGPGYMGTRRALINAGLVAPDAIFPGDRPGLRGPRFTHSDGRTWQITRNWRRGLFHVRWYLRAGELKRRSEHYWNKCQAQVARERELTLQLRELEVVPANAAEARDRLLSDVDWAVRIVEGILRSDSSGIELDDSARGEIEVLLGSIRNIAYDATIRFDPSKRQSIERRVAELRAQDASVDIGFRGALEQILGGEAV